MTDLPRDDDGKRADPAIAATYKIGDRSAFAGMIDPNWPADRTVDLGDDRRPDLSSGPAKIGMGRMVRLGGDHRQQHPTDPVSEHVGDAHRYLGGGEFSSPLDPEPAPLGDGPPMASGRPTIVTRTVATKFDGLEPAVTRIGECYPGAAAAARGTGHDAMGRPVDRIVDLPLASNLRAVFPQDFDRPLDADFDSALLRQLDDRERLGATTEAKPAGGQFSVSRADAIEAAYLRELDDRKRLGSVIGVEPKVGPIQHRSLGRPVPARNSAPPYSWMADQERYEESATAGLDADYRAQVRTSRLWVGFVGLALVVGLLVFYFYRR